MNEKQREGRKARKNGKSGVVGPSSAKEYSMIIEELIADSAVSAFVSFPCMHACMHLPPFPASKDPWSQ